MTSSDTQFRAAVEHYAARPDQRWSLTDCASFLVMEERGIAEAPAYDWDFEQAGFTAVLREDQRDAVLAINFSGAKAFPSST